MKSVNIKKKLLKNSACLVECSHFTITTLLMKQDADGVPESDSMQPFVKVNQELGKKKKKKKFCYMELNKCSK